MKMQERIALTMYEVHKLFYADMVDEGQDFPDYEDLDITVKAYWLALADCSFECIMQPNAAMVDGMLESMKTPMEVYPGDDWHDHNTEAFLKHLAAYINGARIIAK